LPERVFAKRYRIDSHLDRIAAQLLQS
jgi:hypothetical protein